MTIPHDKTKLSETELDEIAHEAHAIRSYLLHLTKAIREDTPDIEIAEKLAIGAKARLEKILKLFNAEGSERKAI